MSERLAQNFKCFQLFLRIKTASNNLWESFSKSSWNYNCVWQTSNLHSRWLVQKFSSVHFLVLILCEMKIHTFRRRSWRTVRVTAPTMHRLRAQAPSTWPRRNQAVGRELRLTRSMMCTIISGENPCHRDFLDKCRSGPLINLRTFFQNASVGGSDGNGSFGI